MSYQSLLARPPAPAALYRQEDVEPRAWDDLVRAGHLVPLTEDVARHRTAPDSAATRATALMRWAARGAAIVDASAAWVHAPHACAVLTGAPPSGTVVRHRLEMHRGPVRLAYTKDQSRPTSRPEITVRRTSFAPDDVLELVVPPVPFTPFTQTARLAPAAPQTVRVTSPTRTVLDLAGNHEHGRTVTAIVALAAAGADLSAAIQRVCWASQWHHRDQTMAALEDAFARWQDG